MAFRYSLRLYHHFIKMRVPLLTTMLWSSGAVLGAVITSSSTEAIPPSKDPWYTIPEGADCSAPGRAGQVLRVRRAPDATQKSMNGLESAWNILYCTSDSHHQPTFAVTTVLIPEHADTTSLVTYQIAYDTACVDFSPSYAMNDLVTAAKDQSVILPMLLNKGWVINMPDYEGPKASFLAGVNSGHAVLDSVRAVLASKHLLNLDKDVRYALYGYSGGAFASEWAAELQPSYAPELQFSGMAIGGLVANVSELIFSHENNGDEAGTAVSTIVGVSQQHPEMEKMMRAALKTTGVHNATGFLSVNTVSYAQATKRYANQNLATYFNNGLDWMRAPAVQRALNNDGLMGYHGIPQMPILVFQAEGDEAVPVKAVDALVDRFCAVGVDIEYRRNVWGQHVVEGILGIFIAGDWLSQVFNGTLLRQDGCTIHHVNTTFGMSEKIAVGKGLAQQGLNYSQILAN